VDEELWQLLAARLADGRGTLLGLWGDVAAVHMAILDDSKTIFLWRPLSALTSIFRPWDGFIPPRFGLNGRSGISSALIP